MRDLLEQVQNAIAGRAYYIALYVSLTLPDICSAMSSEDGQATRQRYIHWFNAYVAPAYMVRGEPSFNGETCYFYRCGVLHQGRAQHPRLRYERILFIEPGAGRPILHNNIMNAALNIDISRFCHDMVAGAMSWLEREEAGEHFQRNSARFMQRHPNGLPPYIVGLPVIA